MAEVNPQDIPFLSGTDRTFTKSLTNEVHDDIHIPTYNPVYVPQIMSDGMPTHSSSTIRNSMPTDANLDNILTLPHLAAARGYPNALGMAPSGFNNVNGPPMGGELTISQMKSTLYPASPPKQQMIQGLLYELTKKVNPSGKFKLEQLSNMLQLTQHPDAIMYIENEANKVWMEDNVSELLSGAVNIAGQAINTLCSDKDIAPLRQGLDHVSNLINSTIPSLLTNMVINSEANIIMGLFQSCFTIASTELAPLIMLPAVVDYSPFQQALL